ncbi:MAG: group II intron maturase-specific domain-containing protein [Blautia faecis]
MKKMKRTVKESINQRYLLVKTEEELIKVLNPKITGWRNYYKTRNDRKWMRAIDWYILCSFCRWNNKKRQQTRKLKGLYATKIRLQEKGLQLMVA